MELLFISDQKEVKNGKVQRQWHINVDEETLQQYSRLESKKAGRPEIQIDYDRIVQLRREDKTNVEI